MSKTIIIPCNLDTQRFNTKPHKGDMGGIKSRIGQNPCELPLEEIAQAVGCNGQAMGFFKCNGAKGEDFVSARQFGLDFDNECLTERAKAKESERVKEYKNQGLSPSEALQKVKEQREPKDFMPIITPEEVKARLEKHGITIGYAFYTPSHERVCEVRKIPLPKFKVFVVTEEVITDPEEAMQIICGLIYLFPEVDNTGKDLARITFGSTKGLITW